MARIWSKKQKCKHCERPIEYNPFTKDWQTLFAGRTQCAANKGKNHEPKG